MSRVKRAVANGRPVQLAIDYGRFNDLMGRTGDPAFRGGHSVLVYGQRRHAGRIEWRLWDPLDDRRRPNIPQGPRWVPRAKLVAAFKAFGGSTNYAGIFGGER